MLDFNVIKTVIKLNPRKVNLPEQEEKVHQLDLLNLDSFLAEN